MSEASTSFNTVLDQCRNRQRRILLAILAAEQRSLTLNDMTKTVVKYNHQTPLTEVSEEVLADIRLSLHHIHLPKLSSGGLISYDPDRNLVEPTEQFEQVQPTVSAILDTDPTLEAPIEP